MIPTRALRAAAAEARLNNQSITDTNTAVVDEPIIESINTTDQPTVNTINDTNTAVVDEPIIESINTTQLSKELECSVCFQLFYQPITLGCGHTFCKECLARAVQHQPQCPLCRIPVALDVPTAKTSTILSNIIEKYYPQSIRDRQQLIEETKTTTSNEASAVAERRLYLFIFPTLVCPGCIHQINLFEPRYVAMMERILNGGSRHFGMQATITSERGVVLEIQEARRVRWNRWYVKTKCIGRYNARNTRIEERFGNNSPLHVSTTTTYYDTETDTNEVDTTNNNNPPNMTLSQLEDYARSLADDVLQHLNPSELSTIRNRCGDSRGPKQLSYYMLSWLRIPNKRELVMNCTSTRQRLNAIVKHIEESRPIAETNPALFFDVIGNETGNVNSSNGLMELMKIVGFCILALMLFYFFPNALQKGRT